MRLKFNWQHYKPAGYRWAFFLLIMFLSTLRGFTLGRAFPRSAFVVNPSSIFARGKDLVWSQTVDAVRTLHNCRDFRFKYYKEFAYFRSYIEQHDIGVGYDAENTIAYAYTKEHSETIWVTYAFFLLSPEEQERTLAHELLHMSGMPKHAKDLVLAKDPIYILTDLCYPWLPKEAK